ncbi:hypothetical protein GCM10023116_47930 [Kistimonas scapharcae]|uniref:Uncharacterized protein n=1 Tax=Kistimonas scapharcae TaxID=1036133 RepID=A0ABP8V978_9GAMM
MGYTHYWKMDGERKHFTEREWHTFRQLWCEVYPKLPKTDATCSGDPLPLALAVCDKSPAKKTIVATDAGQVFTTHTLFESDGDEVTNIMSFNGCHPDDPDGNRIDLGHEGFHILQKGNDDFNFCKTARKPYDFAVCVALGCLRMAVEEDGVLQITSDGGLNDWEPALLFLKDNLESRVIDAYGFSTANELLFIMNTKITPAPHPESPFDPIAWLMS